VDVDPGAILESLAGTLAARLGPSEVAAGATRFVIGATDPITLAAFRFDMRL
jgi:hypothetical protein